MLKQKKKGIKRKKCSLYEVAFGLALIM